LPLFVIVFCNSNALSPAFLQSSDSTAVEKKLDFGLSAGNVLRILLGEMLWLFTGNPRQRFCFLSDYSGLVHCVQDALASYIVQREANGMAVLYWYHTAFIGVARRRYLSSTKQRGDTHSTLADYFLGSWGGGRKKPFQYSSKQLLYMSLKKNRKPSQRSR